MAHEGQLTPGLAGEHRTFWPVTPIVLVAVVQAVLLSLRGDLGDLDVDEPFMAVALAHPERFWDTSSHANVPLAYLLLPGWTTLAGS